MFFDRYNLKFKEHWLYIENENKDFFNTSKYSAHYFVKNTLNTILKLLCSLLSNRLKNRNAYIYIGFMI